MEHGLMILRAGQSACVNKLAGPSMERGQTLNNNASRTSPDS